MRVSFPRFTVGLAVSLAVGLAVSVAALAGACRGRAGDDAQHKTGARELEPPYPLPTDAAPAHAGARLQRAMHLLQRGGERPVKILFYGQSVTRSTWTRDVTDALRARFPQARIVAENRAIGGFVAHQLIRSAEHDVYAFAPDLILLHDMYERPEHFDALIAALRTRTVADIAIQTTHIRDADRAWDDTTRATYIEVAERWGCELIDVRASWDHYLSQHRLDRRALLKRDGHLNGAGDALTSALIQRHLVVLPGPPATDDRVTSIASIAFDAAGRAEVPFAGTRVEAVLAPGPVDLTILVDGKAPSSFVGAWHVTRANDGPDVDWPWEVAAPRLIRTGGAPVAETFTATLSGFDAGYTRFAFRVRGSVTGDDGAGTSDADFVSPSGRVRIDAADWWLAEAHKVKGRRFPEGTTVTWHVRPDHTDRIETAPARVVLAGGLDNTEHVLVLQRTDDLQAAAPVVSLEVHRPPRAPIVP